MCTASWIAYHVSVEVLLREIVLIGVEMASKKSAIGNGTSAMFGFFFWVAVAVTAIWFVYAIALTIPQVVNCSSVWKIVDPFGWFPTVEEDGFKCLDLNEFGDFLAGSFAPLAFLWLVVAVFVQSAELKEQRLALVAQLEESQRQTSFHLAEQAETKARSAKEKLHADYRQVRSIIVKATGWSEVGSDDVAFLLNRQPYLFQLIKSAHDAIVNSGDYGRMDNIRKLYPCIEILQAEKVNLSDTDLQVYKSIKMPEFLDLLVRSRDLDEG